MNYIKKAKSTDLKLIHEMYSFIHQDTWERFVKSRNTSEFLAKSQRGKEKKSKIYILLYCLVEDMKILRRQL